jgi:predicted O-methyltransferase YrrM
MINSDIEKYAEEYSSKETELLHCLNRETHLKVVMPRMLSGALQGKLLEMISCMKQPKQILEIGTYTGYSAICLSKGLALDGVLHTIEKNPELELIAKKYFAEAEIEHQVQYYQGDALDILPTINEKFDLVFLDADKKNYLNYYYLIFDKLNSGAIILADNVFWSGKVLNSPDIHDKETIGIIEFNEFIQNDERVENVILPIRDGLSLIRKK